MNSDEDARVSQLLRSAQGEKGAAGGGRDRGRGQGCNSSPRFSLQVLLPPSAKALCSHGCRLHDPCAAPSPALLMGAGGSPGPPSAFHW